MRSVYYDWVHNFTDAISITVIIITKHVDGLIKLEASHSVVPETGLQENEDRIQERKVGSKGM